MLLDNYDLYNSHYQINAHALIGQSAMVYCTGKLMEKSCLLNYKSNRANVSMVYRHDKPLGMLEEHLKNS